MDSSQRQRYRKPASGITILAHILGVIFVILLLIWLLHYRGGINLDSNNAGNISNPSADLHFFGVYDGHGCSHVAMKCKDRLHEIVRGELESREEDAWKETMERSFLRMDEEVTN
ncbi:protein-serine,threonine phosphatase [Sarracenia purpurea var. burkii]